MTQHESKQQTMRPSSNREIQAESTLKTLLANERVLGATLGLDHLRLLLLHGRRSKLLLHVLDRHRRSISSRISEDSY